MKLRLTIVVGALLALILMTSACQQAEPTPTPPLPTLTPIPTVIGVPFPCGPSEYIGERHEHFLHWAGNGSHLVFDVGEDTVWSLDVESGHPQLIVDVDTDYDASIGGPRLGYGFYADVHPDDTRLVYSTCEFSPYVEKLGSSQESYKIAAVTIDGAGKELLTRNYHFGHYPALSSDGSRFAFITLTGQTDSYQPYRYYPYDPRELHVVRLGVLPSDAKHPDHSRIEFAFSGLPEGIALFPPVWSPDDKYLAYLEKDRVGVYAVGVLHTVRSDRTGTSVRIGATTALPTWFPDSTRLAYAAFNSDIKQSTIVGIKPDGSDSRIIWESPTDTPSEPITELSLSPDGSQFLFVSDHTYLVGADGSDLRRLEGIPPRYDGARPIAWSPDGSRIAIYNPDRGLITVSPDGTDLRVLMEIDADGQPVLTAAPSP